MTKEPVHNLFSDQLLPVADSLRKLRQDMAEGLLYTHSKLSSGSKNTMEGMSFLYALIEILEEKGLLGIEELDQRKAVVADRLIKKFKKSEAGAMFQHPEHDKYTFEGRVHVACEERIHLCKAACCRLPFALSKQDIREGIVRWNLGQPYLIDQGEDGFCNHLDRRRYCCTIYEQRPVPCHGFDCSTDKRIWSDFSNMVINPEIQQTDWPRCLSADTANEYKQ